MQRPKLTFPDDVAKYVTEAYERHDSILEYGSGGSTVLASELEGKHVVSVESDARWTLDMQAYLEGSPKTRSKPRLIPVNVGPTGPWGRPLDHSHYHLFPWYALSPWVSRSQNDPDFSLVLVDGRFRTACFLISMAFARGPLEIIFDDYKEREFYHFIEEYAKPVRFIGRAAVFERDPSLDWGAIAYRHTAAFYDDN
ncbi:hypothetical protein [Oceanicaulis alexandrii]|uniref:hypothetical protein n=1 Tax=Oceanicaulis alexandrii TaxID=153233 RepID=UPI002357899B|nr:hypothetical protein [Oceanicaulis alexandrii]